MTFQWLPSFLKKYCYLNLNIDPCKWAQASLGGILVSSPALIKERQELFHNGVYEGDKKGQKGKKEAWETFEREDYNINDFMNNQYSFLALGGDGTIFEKRDI